MREASRLSHNKRPEGVPHDSAGEAALRRWFAERHLATITADVGEIEHLDKLAHHVRAFLAQIVAWQRMPTYGD